MLESIFFGISTFSRKILKNACFGVCVFGVYFHFVINYRLTIAKTGFALSSISVCEIAKYAIFLRFLKFFIIQNTSADILEIGENDFLSIKTP